MTHAEWRRYAAEASFYMLLWQAVAAADEAERRRRRDERLPVRFSDEVWDRVPYMRWNGATGHWERFWHMRARS